jgi:hypothetical protein
MVVLQRVDDASGLSGTAPTEGLSCERPHVAPTTRVPGAALRDHGVTLSLPHPPLLPQ